MKKGVGTEKQGAYLQSLNRKQDGTDQANGTGSAAIKRREEPPLD